MAFGPGDIFSRSIPAHAGEPPGSRGGGGWCEVYPRPRGGTVHVHVLRPSALGLSPPTRGNRPCPCPEALCPGSIPAHAGEPSRSTTTGNTSGVYPRPRGGTLRRCPRRPCGCGLSPPTRGNLLAVSRELWRVRSIPAHAGEPGLDAEEDAEDRVYPRPRGGTFERVTCSSVGGGLSPPTRGNPPNQPFAPAPVRSISAHAGEPRRGGRRSRIRRVYPRPRGGTAVFPADGVSSRGLSPPTRGNRLSFQVTSERFRSIPAHAGEPRTTAGLPAR